MKIGYDLVLQRMCSSVSMLLLNQIYSFQPEFVNQFSLGESSTGIGPLSLETPSKIKNKRKRSSGKHDSVSESPSKKRKSSDGDESHLPDSKKKKQTSVKKGRKSSEKGIPVALEWMKKLPSF